MSSITTTINPNSDGTLAASFTQDGTTLKFTPASYKQLPPSTISITDVGTYDLLGFTVSTDSPTGSGNVPITYTPTQGTVGAIVYINIIPPGSTFANDQAVGALFYWVDPSIPSLYDISFTTNTTNTKIIPATDSMVFATSQHDPNSMTLLNNVQISIGNELSGFFIYDGQVCTMNEDIPQPVGTSTGTSGPFAISGASFTHGGFFLFVNVPIVIPGQPGVEITKGPVAVITYGTVHPYPI